MENTHQNTILERSSSAKFATLAGSFWALPHYCWGISRDFPPGAQSTRTSLQDANVWKALYKLPATGRFKDKINCLGNELWKYPCGMLQLRYHRSFVAHIWCETKDNKLYSDMEKLLLFPEWLLHLCTTSGECPVCMHVFLRLVCLLTD